MKATKMRINGKKIEQNTFDLLVTTLNNKLYDLGFMTNVTQVNGSSINISQGGRCFSIDTSRLGYNARVQVPNSYGFMVGSVGKKGYTRTNVPTWEQRVIFNNVLNEVLDSFNVSCSIKAHYFTIRDGLTSFDECDWESVVPNGDYCYVVQRIKTLKEVA